MGLSTNTTRVIVFCISAFLAGIGGILYGGAVNFATTSDSHFTSFQSLVLLAVLALAPFGEPWYALFMGIVIGHSGLLDEPERHLLAECRSSASSPSRCRMQGGQPEMPPAVLRNVPRTLPPGTQAAAGNCTGASGRRGRAADAPRDRGWKSSSSACGSAA